MNDAAERVCPKCKKTNCTYDPDDFVTWDLPREQRLILPLPAGVSEKNAVLKPSGKSSWEFPKHGASLPVSAIDFVSVRVNGFRIARLGIPHASNLVLNVSTGAIEEFRLYAVPGDDRDVRETFADGDVVKFADGVEAFLGTDRIYSNRIDVNGDLTSASFLMGTDMVDDLRAALRVAVMEAR